MEDLEQETVRLTAWVRGRVQGVGFRWWVRARALELGLAGSATNLSDGRVEVVAEGTRKDCERLLELLEADPLDGRPLVAGPPDRPGKVTGVTRRWSEPRGEASGFLER
ncbi:acylphosphatase [Actinomadura nitritigenes]|uniref:acylphosphatase n=1 Tax=Actinomadura nitritigenes TaxID=134602 RepID=A0ABS3QSS5_9ACTN|nr:acylphosphatase [Actinomadura nitritigenes]MBO2437038.1 acylphosphatase [Actinomadura nitritigenes]